MYRLIDELFGFGRNSVPELLIVVAMLPFFFYLCSLVEKLNTKITAAVRSKYTGPGSKQPV